MSRASRVYFETKGGIERANGDILRRTIALVEAGLLD